jgi:hypothetical protein
MNFVFSKQRISLPKYVTGAKPYTIDLNKILLKVKGAKSDDIINTSAFLINMILKEEFEFALKKKKTCIFYINPYVSLDTVKNIKKTLPDLGLNVKKFFLVDENELKKIHRHVDQIIKPK